jgi:mono/diheme cytochrome c family protein
MRTSTTRASALHLASAFLLSPFALAASPPRDSLPMNSPEWPANYRLHLELAEAGEAKARLGDDLVITLSDALEHDIALEQPPKGKPVLRVWSGGKLVRGPEEVDGVSRIAAPDFPEAKLDLGADFTAVVNFETKADGTLFAKCSPQGEWSAGAKALFIEDGRLVYDIGWLGKFTGGPAVNDGKPHTAVLSVSGGAARLWLDGKVIAEQDGFTKPDAADFVFKVGRAAPDFGGELSQGNIAGLRVWSRALPEAEIALLFKANGTGANTPDFTHTPGNGGGEPVIEGAKVKSGWVQALETSDHAEIVGGWNAGTLKEGEQIYNTLCVVCHGTKEQPGSLPTALRFGEGPFKNGADPYSMFVTLTKGYGQMTPQPQYTTKQKYAVIQYIRETFLRPHDPKSYSAVTPEYLSNLPKALTRTEAEKEDRSLPQFKRMDLGPALYWTYQIAPDHIAQKGIAIRLDEGPGGVSKGRAWMVYDHDTMSLATATTGGFVNWKGIAFDGSHGTHTSLTGERHFINPPGPGWSTGAFEDTRPIGKEGKPYGPVSGMKFEGMYLYGNKAILAATIHGTKVLELPDWLEYGATPVFTRTLNVADSKVPLRLRVAPDTVNVILTGSGTLTKEDGFWIATLPGGSKSVLAISRLEPDSLAALAKTMTPLDLAPLTRGGPSRWPQTVTTTSVPGKEDALFVSDEFPLPVENPWDAWMRPGGFDFTPDGKSAVVAMWNGDVWRVDGLMAKAPAELTWRRIASGLFQPLGVKFRGDDLFVTCRDQLARLRDFNDDGEIDFIECFNNDHQVTEHFHEFAMGLQTDADGNFYYAKSARHALDSVVPHHGTLLRVSADGSKTDIVANGFRAANGICLNDDGSFFVTDQEGHWTPKNRINRVKPGGFYGNMFGYSNVTDSSDAAMEQPMIWITNAKDRSPAELLWVPKNAWGTLGGSLLNLSYGTGRVFIVPHEKKGDLWQGAVCELPMPAFRSGVMRGRFGSDGALYASGMFAWAGSATSPGGFYRIRRSDQPVQVPLVVHATKGELSVTFSEPLEPVKAGDFTFKTWSLKRTSGYGSKHFDERPVEVRAARLSSDGRTLTLDIPELAPTDCYELAIKKDGMERILHGTILEMGEGTPDP